MANQARNDNELQQMLRPALRLAVEYVLEKIDDENQYAIMHEVYYGEGVPDQYERTGEFAKAWDTAVHSTSAISSTVEGQFFYKPSEMTYNPTEFQHGSPPTIPKGGDAREFLADIIYGGLAGSLFGDGYWTEKRDAWSVLLKRVGKSNMKKWMKEGLESVGLTIQTHNTPIQVTEI